MPSCWVPVELGFGGGTGGSVGSEGLLANVCEMAGFVAVAADFSGRWAQVTKVLLFAIPEKKKQVLFPGLSGGVGRLLLASANAV